MVLLSGTLQKSLSSMQAVLRCELGAFSVVDERLAAVSAGDYEGLFEVEAIQPHLLPSTDGTVQWGVVAVLKRFSLSVIGVGKQPAAQKPQRLTGQAAQISLFREEENSDSLTKPLEPATLAAPTTPEAEAVKTVTAVATVAVNLEASASCAEVSLEEISSTECDADTTTVLTDTQLFGDGCVFSETMTLDVTESREVLRRQRECLKTLGYRFDAAHQVWRRAPVSPSEE